MAKPDIRALTGLRGIAAGMVLAYHFWPVGHTPAPGLAQAIGKGYLWVDLFFILSGYVLALNYGTLFADDPFSLRAFGAFFLRRIARIYPAYIVFLLFQLGFVLLVYGTVTEAHHWGGAEALPAPALDIPANVLLVQSVGLAPSLVGQAWSVSVEFAAYCAFPLLVTIAVYGKRMTAAFSLVLACLLLVAVVHGNAVDGASHSGPLDAYDGTQFTPLMRCLGDFILGLLAFRAGRCRQIAHVIGGDAVAAGLLVAIAAMFATGIRDLAIVALFPALVLCLAENTGAPASLFQNAPVVRLGELSYAIYLLHPLLQAPMDSWRQQLEQVLPAMAASVVSGAAAVAIVWMLADGIHRWVERPGRHMLRHIGPGGVALST